MAKANTNVRLAGVTKHFGAHEILNDISLDIESGEFIVFLGGSGSGKSTLLRMIAGLETVTRGEIWIGGRRVDNLAPGRRDVAMVFQSYALYPHMTVRANMAFGLVNIGTPRDEIDRRVGEAAKILEMDHLLDRKPSQLSGGQRQRVAIGRAIVREPKVFLLDEPLSNLDAGLRTRTRLELAQLHNRLGATMIFVTHDQIEAMTLATRIVLLHNKGIEQVGTPMEIYTRPRTRYVAQFIGSPGMNFLPVAKLGDAVGRAVVTLANGTTLKTHIPSTGLPSTDLTAGIRPEHVVTTTGKGNLSGMVVTVERMGDRSLIYTRLDDGSQLVSSDAGVTNLKGGDRVSLVADGAKAAIFDADGKGYHADN